MPRRTTRQTCSLSPRTRVHTAQKPMGEHTTAGCWLRYCCSYSVMTATRYFFEGSERAAGSSSSLTLTYSARTTIGLPLSAAPLAGGESHSSFQAGTADFVMVQLAEEALTAYSNPSCPNRTNAT